MVATMVLVRAAFHTSMFTVQQAKYEGDEIPLLSTYAHFRNKLTCLPLWCLFGIFLINLLIY